MTNRIRVCADPEYLQHILLRTFTHPDKAKPATPAQVTALLFQNDFYLGEPDQESKIGNPDSRIVVNYDITPEFHQQIVNTGVPLFARVDESSGMHVISLFEEAKYFFPKK